MRTDSNHCSPLPLTLPSSNISISGLPGTSDLRPLLPSNVLLTLYQWESPFNGVSGTHCRLIHALPTSGLLLLFHLPDSTVVLTLTSSYSLNNRESSCLRACVPAVPSPETLFPEMSLWLNSSFFQIDVQTISKKLSLTSTRSSPFIPLFLFKVLLTTWHITHLSFVVHRRHSLLASTLSLLATFIPLRARAWHSLL